MPRVVRFHQTGEPEVLKLEEIPVVEPGPDEIRLNVKALGLNRAESMFRRGQYLEQPQFPARIGYEASGIVEAVGAKVRDFAVGDAVSTVPAFSMNQYGVYGEVATVPAAAVVKHPASLSWEVATSLWMQYLTAWGALVHLAKIGKGDFVLIPAASSSVGVAAIQMCHAEGAIPIALTRTSAKAAELKTHGATHVVVTEEEDLVARVNKITGGKGARVAFDPVGGPTFEKLVAAMAPHGLIFEYGALSTEPTPFPLFGVLGKMLTIRGYLLFEFTQQPDILKHAVEYVLKHVQDGIFQPKIAKMFSLDAIVEAHRYLESNQQIGKVVVMVP